VKRTATLPFLSVAALSIGSPLSTGCVAGGSAEELSTIEPQGTTAGGPHLMLTQQAHTQAVLAAEAQAQTQQATPSSGFHIERTNVHHLTYYGGPINQNVNVIPVYWNSSYAYQTTMNSFYAAVVTGTYVTFLQQYNTSSPSQHFGAGTRGTPHVATQTATNITDSNIQSFLTSQFNSGALPKPTNSTYYPVHFPPGVSINDGSGNLSCVQFCAYHGTYVYNGQDVYYGVLPDTGQSGCNGGCGASTVANNNTSVASHEYTEMLTDPAVGLATVYGPPLGWYNATYGEIGDICNGQQTTAVLGDGKSYTVQKEWSNSSNTCATP
jgi:hypothetical protein